MQTAPSLTAADYSLQLSDTVTRSYAHRKEGNTLVWDYNYASLQKMSQAEVEQGIRVRYKK